MTFLLDPKMFNYTILTLYLLNAARWGYEGKWGDCAYWLGAFWITCAVTWGYSR